ncbi:MAG: amidohydrolase [Treponema sp.]|nr:amidohydrolase [Treponema sp.]
MDEIERLIIQRIDEHRQEIINFADDIYKHAELGYKEFRTTGKFKEFLQDKVEFYQEGLAITGAKAYINRSKKANFSLSLIGELDALRIPAHVYANPETQGAHCCGHHAQLAGVVGSAFALLDPKVKAALDGQLVFFAVPAEEYGEVEFKKQLMEQGKIKYGGGKCELIRIGAFDDIDISVAHHISPKGISVGSGANNGFVSKVITIQGKAAHAAGSPEKGINALSAASLGLSALALNRETFRDEDWVRVHPILTQGGNLVNVVPDKAVIETLVRARTTEAILDAAAKTDRSFKAGAQALGAGYRIETLPGYLPALPQEFPKELYDIVREASDGRPVKQESLNSHSTGSTDVGDVQHLQPVLTFNTGGITGGLHQADFAVVDEEEAYVLTAKLFALIAYRLLKNGAALGKKIKAAYKPVYASKEAYIAALDSFYSTEEVEIS